MAHTLLLADDSVTIQRVIELTFADEDIRVVTVGDGQQAIERIEAEPPDIILADVGMPHHDGYEVATHVKRTPHLAHIPVLLLTGAFEPVDEARASAAGCDGVLAKPFEPQMVINRVKELLSAAGPRQSRHAPAPPIEPRSTAAGPVLKSAPAGRAESLVERDPIEFDAAEEVETRFGDLHVAHQAAPDTAPTIDSRSPALSLDEYFDRLDAAFGGSGTVSPALQALDEQLAADRFAASLKAADLTREPAPASGEPVAVLETSAAAPVPAISRVESASQPLSSRAAESGAGAPLADAFSTLLAAERGEAIPSSVRVPLRSLFPALSPSNDELIDQVARRVLDRLTDHRFVSDIVGRVAERVVREEIERLRAALRDK